MPGDSFRLIREVPDACVDLVMTDVPYPDMKIHDGTRRIIASEEWIEWFKPLAIEIKRVLKPTGSFVTTINSKKDRGFYFDWVAWMRQTLEFHFVLPHYWVKKNIIPGSVKRMRFPRDGVDHIAWFGATPRYYANLGAIDNWKKYNPATTTPTNMIYASTMDDMSYHRAKKKTGIDHTGKYPELIPDLFIQILTQPGGTVLEPFLGTGTTAIVAAKHGRECMAFERNMKNVTLARAAMKEARKLYNFDDVFQVLSARKWKLFRQSQAASR